MMLGLMMLKLNKKIIDKMNKLMKFKDFMNKSEESILILKEELIQYTNNQFLQTFKQIIECVSDKPDEAEQLPKFRRCLNWIKSLINRK